MRRDGILVARLEEYIVVSCVSNIDHGLVIAFDILDTVVGLVPFKQLVGRCGLLSLRWAVLSIL